MTEAIKPIIAARVSNIHRFQHPDKIVSVNGPVTIDNDDYMTRSAQQAKKARCVILENLLEEVVK